MKKKTTNGSLEMLEVTVPFDHAMDYYVRGFILPYGKVLANYTVHMYGYRGELQFRLMVKDADKRTHPKLRARKP